MSEPHVVAALKDKRAELAGIIADLEKGINGHRADLVHIDATLRMFAPDTEADGIRPKGLSLCVRYLPDLGLWPSGSGQG